MPNRPYSRLCRFCGETGQYPVFVKQDSERRLYTIVQRSKELCVVCAGKSRILIYYDPPEDYTVTCSSCDGSSWELETVIREGTREEAGYFTVLAPCHACHGLGFTLLSGKDPLQPYDEAPQSEPVPGKIKRLFPQG